MIIIDNEHFKLDVTINKDGWIHFTKFVKPHITSDEWKTATIGISPDGWDSACAYIHELRLKEPEGHGISTSDH